MLRKIFGPEREEVIGDWRKLHNEELRGLNCSVSTFINRVIKSKGTRSVGRVARMKQRNRARFGEET